MESDPFIACLWLTKMGLIAVKDGSVSVVVSCQHPTLIFGGFPKHGTLSGMLTLGSGSQDHLFRLFTEAEEPHRISKATRR